MSNERKRREALIYHSKPKPGKIKVIPSKNYRSQTDLSLAYSPGVAHPCLEIDKNPEANIHKTIYRPWGNYSSISEGKNWQVKKIMVKKGESLSLQLHNQG